MPGKKPEKRNRHKNCIDVATHASQLRIEKSICERKISDVDDRIDAIRTEAKRTERNLKFEAYVHETRAAALMALFQLTLPGVRTLWDAKNV